MREVGLLVELGGLEAERVDEVVDGLGTLLEIISALLGGRVSACGKIGRRYLKR